MAGRGRPKGARSSKDVASLAKLSELAKTHAPSAIKALADICVNGESEAARVSAATAILDRAYGKPAQSLVGADNGPLQIGITWLPTQK